MVRLKHCCKFAMTTKNLSRFENVGPARRPKARRQDGFTLLELMIVMAVAAIVSVMAVTRIAPALRTARAETGIQTVAGWMRRTQERAVDERRVYRLSFIAPQTVQVDLVNQGPPITFTFVQSVQLPNDIAFQTVTGLPTGVNAPDGFGAGGLTPINLGIDYGGGETQIFYQADGRALDVVGRSNSGVVYTCRAGEILSCRAATVWGTTGRTKVWRVQQTGPTSYQWSQ